MPSTHLSLNYHLIFSTKNRTQLITDPFREQLHAYLGGIEATNFERVYAIDHAELMSGGNQMQALQGLVGESLFAAGLGGGSGWVLLGYNHQFGMLENYWMADHMHSPVATTPLLAIDMYEHSYHMDYGAATARYIDAFFQNVDWDVVVARVESLR